MTTNENLSKNGYHEEEERELRLADYVRIFRRRWWIILLALVLVLVPTALITFTTSPVYQATATIMIQDDKSMQQILFDEQKSAFFGRQPKINDQVYLLKSRIIAELVIQALMKSAVRDSLRILDEGFEEALKLLRKNLEAAPIKETNYFIEMSVKGSSPFEAAYLVNTVAEIYQNQDQELGRGEIREVVEFLKQQLQIKERDLKASEENLKSYQETENIADLTGEAQEAVNQLAQFESLYNNALTDLGAYEKRLEYLNQQLGVQKENLQGNIAQISNPLIVKLRDELAEAERKASVLLAQGIAEGSDDLKKLRDKQGSIKKRLVEETQKLILGGLTPGDPLAQAQELVGRVIEAETEIHTLKARSEALKRVVDNYSKKLEKLPEKSLKLARLKRYKQVDENLYYMMKEKFEESQISMAGQIGKVRIIDRATEPVEPIAPKKMRNLLLGSLLGLGLGLGISLFLEHIDKSLRSIEDIERLGLPFIGAIPHIGEGQKSGFFSIHAHGRDKKSAQEARRKVISHANPKSPITEAYRMIRTNVQLSQADARIKCLLVTSPGPGEGKSTTTVNLGTTLAQMGFKTILVDTDLRRPALHRFFDLEKKKGLTNILFDGAEEENIHAIADIDNLSIMPSGLLPPNPSELLGSQRMKVLLENLKDRFDFVILDSPPIIAVTDAQILAPEADGVLLVVRAGVSQVDAIKRTKALLAVPNTRLLGVVLNDMRAEHAYGSYYYNYNYQYYGAASSGKNGKVKKKKSVPFSA
jgi:capsular exopolysaccharide synthesis family protein